jgi:type IV pilus assembly protein PilE
MHFTIRGIDNSGRVRTAGFTLIELMVVVLVVALLAAIAVPTFQDQLRRGRRAEAMNGLEALAQSQERWRANNPVYASAGDLGAVPSSEFYAFSIPVNTARAYTLRATATGAQLRDSACLTIEMTSAGLRTPAECWAR